MEIKVGDKVRVREDAPRMYASIYDEVFINNNSEVIDVEDDSAWIRWENKRVLAIPFKYLIKVEDEAKEPEYRKGDKVRYIGDMQPTYKDKVFVIDGDVFFNDRYNQWQTSSIKPFMWDGLSVCNVPLSDLEPYTEPTEGTLLNANYPQNDLNIDEIVARGYVPDPTSFFKLDWDAYAADLAKEIAVKVANKYNDPKEAAYYTVKVAKAVAEGLKRK